MMAIRVEWGDVDETILQWEFEADWNWSDYMEAEAESRRILDAVAERVDVILDLSKSKMLDSARLTQLPDPEKISIFSHPNVRSCVIIEDRDFANRVMDLGQQPDAVLATIDFAEDCDTAYDLIARMQ